MSPPAMDPAGAPVYDKAYTTRILLLLAGLVAIILYVEGMLTPSLPEIQATFGITSSQASLILSSYLVVGVALTPVVGKLGDIYGKRLVLGIVLVTYAACVSVTGFSPNFTFMIAARAFQGVGLTIIPLGMALVREEFPKSEVTRAQGILAAMIGVGFAISLPLGAWVSNTYGWRFTYHSAIPAVLLLTVLTIVFLKESAYKRPNVKVDFVGAFTLGLALALVVLGLSEGPTWGWTSLPTLGTIVLGVLLMAPVYLFERRFLAQGGEPILDLRLLGKRNVLVSNVVLGFAGLGMFLALFSLSYRFELPGPSSFGESIFIAGLSLVPMALSMLVFAPIAGSTVSRTGVKPLAVLGGALGAVGFLAVALASTLMQIYAAEILIGAGLAFLNASVVNFLVLSVEPREMGLATSMNSVFRYLGSSIGAPIGGSILTTYLVAWSPAAHAPALMVPGKEAFELPFLIAAVMMAIAGGLSLLGREVLGPRASPGPKSTGGAPRGTSGSVGSLSPSR
ncbi:MAG: MFS transporter [Thermoplasmata archaeon]|nr:MFS transporter [Thermoplasmata archaeon]